MIVDIAYRADTRVLVVYWDGSANTAEAIRRWADVEVEVDYNQPGTPMRVPCKDGMQIATVGDYILKYGDDQLSVSPMNDFHRGHDIVR